MAWPLSQDYNEAIQSPAANFADPDLKRGEAVTNALGLPMPFSGNFADVYEVRGPNGRWAVKCFTREAPGLRERYTEISRHLRQAKLPFTVDFNYLEEGIRIGGRWYPVLKMQWVEGLTFNQFVSQNLDKPTMLEGLSQIWGRMAKYLRTANAAHCDLQHGNVMLVPGSGANSLAIKLIDYDGMWVPALARGKSGEVGHPSYQHPQRLREGTYSLEVDRFPLLLIATALRAVKVGGAPLWQKYDNGDNLLFKEVDLREPGQSELFRELSHLGDPTTVALTAAVRKALDGGLDSAPLLEELPTEVRPAPAGPPRTVAGVSVAKMPSAVYAAEPVEAEPDAFSAFDPRASGANGPPSKRAKPAKGGLPGGVWVWAGAGVAALALLACGGGAGAVYLAMRGDPAKVAQGITRPAQTETPRATLPDQHNGPSVPPTVPPPVSPTKSANPVTPVAPVFIPGSAGEFKRADLSSKDLLWAGGGNPLAAAQELVAVLGDPPPPPKPEDRLLFRLSETGAGVCLSPDGKTLAMTSGKDVIKFDTETGKPLQTLRGHAKQVLRVAYNPLGNMVVTSGADQTVKLWYENRDFFTVEGPKAAVIPVAVSQDSKLFAGGSRVWKTDDGKEAYRLPEQEVIDSVAFSVDNKWLATGGPTGVRLWQAATGKPGPTLLRAEAKPGTDPAFTVAFSPNGQYLAAGGEDALVVWEAAKLAASEVKEFRRYQTPGSGASFTPDGQTIFTGRHLKKDAEALVINRVELFANKQSTLPPLPCKGEQAHFALSRDGRTLVVAGDKDREVGMYDAPTGRPVADPAQVPPVALLAISPDNKLLASYSHDRKLTIWDAVGRKKLSTIPPWNPKIDVKSLAFRPDGKTLVAGDSDGGVRAWILSGQEVWLKQGHGGATNAVAFSPDNQTLASGGADGSVKLWDGTNGTERRTVRDSGTAVRGVTFSPDGKTLAAACAIRADAEILFLWDTATGESQPTLKFMGGGNKPAFFPDNKRVVALGDVTGFDGYAMTYLWSREKPTAAGNFAWGRPVELAVRADSRVVTAERSGRVITWDPTATSNGVKIQALCPQGVRPRAVALSADANYLAVGSEDGLIALFRLENPAPVVVAPPVKSDPKPPTDPIPPVMTPVVKKSEVRLPMPDLAARQTALTEIQEDYKADYAKQKPDDLAALAARLLNAGLEMKDKPATRFVLFKEARDLAARAGSLDLSLRSAGEMANHFAVSAPEMKEHGLQVAQSSAKPTSFPPIAASALAVADDAVEEDDYDLADRLVKLALAGAQKGGSPALATAAKSRAQEVAALRKAFAAVQGSLRVLADKPDDPDANLAVGKFYALEKGDWDRGLAPLGRGSDPKLKALAQADLEIPFDAKPAEELGERYASQATSVSGTAKTNLLYRAFYWYSRARSKLQGDGGNALGKKMNAFDDALPEGRPVVLYAMYGTQKNWVDVTTLVRSPIALLKGKRVAVQIAPAELNDTLAAAKPKMLVVVYRYRGWVQLLSTGLQSLVPGHEPDQFVFLPGMYWPQGEDSRPKPDQELVVLFAKLALGNSSYPCTARLQALTRGGTLVANPSDFGQGVMTGDNQRAALIVYRLGGKIHLSVTPESEPIALGVPMPKP